MARYSVQPLVGTDYWGIFDHEVNAFCTLPDKPTDPHPNLLPLEWRGPLSAEAWLYRCYKEWANGTVPAPKGWRRGPADYRVRRRASVR